MPDTAWPLHRVLGLALLIGALLNSGSLDATPLSKREEPLVDLAVDCPGILIELRYATKRNLTGAVVYPKNARALLRRSVAERLRRAHEILAQHGMRIKVWDAYRPPIAQEILWEARPNRDFVGEPKRGGSLHSWGVAVDVTLADRFGRDVCMPTDFDELTPNAARRYSGGDPVVAQNLALLQKAMVAAGFLAMRDEWWHFAAEDFRDFGPVTPPVALVPEVQ